MVNLTSNRLALSNFLNFKRKEKGEEKEAAALPCLQKRYPTWACSATFEKRRWWTAVFVAYVCLREKNEICCVKLVLACARRVVVTSLEGVETVVKDQVRWQRTTVTLGGGSWRIWGQSKWAAISWEKSMADLARVCTNSTTSLRCWVGRAQKYQIFPTDFSRNGYWATLFSFPFSKWPLFWQKGTWVSELSKPG